ncbi:DMT family transporter [Hahella ganghwensis]|uniref:aromatic amino acid exporter YddG n=1 Tax=Hahella ganghwensis TaxID=286420 RepID=UPI00037811B3|nr:EamA family transporter [Hahella ganghwensis]
MSLHQSPQHRSATCIGFISIFLWGTLALFTKMTGGNIPPFQLMSMCFGLAFLLMACRWWKQRTTGLRYLRQPPLAWILGVGGYFGYHLCYFLAMGLAPAVEVSLLAYLWPLLIVLMASFLPGEILLARHLVGALLALIGCWLLIGKGATGFAWEYLPGYLLALACAIIWSSYSVASRLVKQVTTDAVGWFCAVTAILALLCHLLWEATVWPNSVWEWAGVVGLGLGPVGIAFFTWDYGIKHGNIQLLGVLAYAAPLISTILLVTTNLAEASWSLVLACLTIVGGSLIAGWKSRPKGRLSMDSAVTANQ